MPLRFLNSVTFTFELVCVVYPLFPFALVGITVIWSGCMSHKIEATQQCHSLKAKAHFSTLVRLLHKVSYFESR